MSREYLLLLNKVSGREIRLEREEEEEQERRGKKKRQN
jgi:hypothetical protein